MNWGWLSMDKLMDPGTSSGAVALAFVIIILAWLISIATTRLLQRPLWTVGKLKRRVDETVIRYILRVKNLIIFLWRDLFMKDLPPARREEGKPEESN
jgi:small conductance mechanosensitive channel